MWCVQEGAYAHWLSLVRRRAPVATGEVLDFSAPPRARHEHARDAAQRHFLADMQAALRAHTSLIPCAPPACLRSSQIACITSW